MAAHSELIYVASEAGQRTSTRNIRDTVLPLVRQISRKVESVLEARAQSTVSNARIGTRLGSSVLHRVAVGNPTVFSRVEEGVAINTAVTILCDGSGSMSAISHLAATAVIALGDVLHRSDVPFSAGIFAGDHGSNVFRIRKTFSSSWDMKFDPIVPVAKGGTPLAGAMNATILPLLQREEDRKILFIVTDGVPGNPYEVWVQLGELLRMGVEPRFCLIESRERPIEAQFLEQVLRGLPIPYGIARSREDLPGTIFKALADAL
ncbi:MAG: hypothetical protein PHT60_16570 [Acidiphilium sp.]|nr:hypothetical protein [Acidiphilium sp.]